ncbi:MAG: M24 family metallopeptidase [Anaerolineales bacterium]|jgi:Xaa-Pro aminopeptidase
MKKDLDAIMEKKDLDAILVSGPVLGNPALYYFTGHVHMTNGVLIKKRGEEPVLFYHSMEREEAAKTGHETRNLDEYRILELLKEVGGDRAKAAALRYKKVLTDLDITSGRLSVFGKIEAGVSFRIYNLLQEMMPNLEIVGEVGSTTILEAMETKDEDEVAHVRKMGQITVDIVDKVAKFLQSHKTKEEVLIKADGEPLTVGDVKRQINLWAVEAGVENPHDCIFAIGHDAGVPHSSGTPEDAICLGKTIVFDIFLQEPAGGYHYDFTRTWCLGYAPEEAQKLYEDVKAVFEEIMGGLEANAPFKALQEKTCDLFEAQGHPTVKSDPLTQEGYVHSLGHGLGLNLHEQPFTANEEATLKPGVVVTIEPGLYYPEKEMGVRLEDSVYIHADGSIEVLAEYPHDLVLPIEN